MINNYTTANSAVFIRSFTLCFLGIYLLISNIIWFISKLCSKEKYAENILFISNLKYTFGQSKNILFLISVLVSMTIFFCTLAATMLSDSQKFATQYNPYHIAYTEVFDKNRITDKDLKSIITNGETQLDTFTSMEFIYEGSAKQMILSDEILNSNLGSQIHVQKDHFINLFQVVMDDHYQHDLYEIKQLEIKTMTGSYKYVSQGQMTEVLFNRIPLTMSYVILNNSDYLKVKAEIDPVKISSIKLINFKDWFKTKGIFDKLSHELEMYNENNTRVSPSDSLFKPVSRINDYSESKQGGSFILFFLSSFVILHFKLLTEFEREKIKYKKLYKIGITEKEISTIISKELKVLFILPVLIGTMVAIFYSYSMLVGVEMVAMKYSLIFSLIYLLIQFVFYLIYKRYYIKRFYRIFGK